MFAFDFEKRIRRDFRRRSAFAIRSKIELLKKVALRLRFDVARRKTFPPSGKNSSILRLIAVAMRCRLRFSLWFRRA